MLERKTLGQVAPKPHSVFKVDGRSAYEFVLTRDGFGGGFTIFYQRHAPTALRHLETAPLAATRRFLGEPVALSDIPLARRHLQVGRLGPGNDYLSSRTALYVGDRSRLSALRGRLPAMPESVFCNGDFDELFFVTEGEGAFQTIYGHLPFAKHDYVLIPRGTSYWLQSSTSLDMLVIEGAPSLAIPPEFRNEHGQLKLEAPYTHRDFRSPTRLLSEAELAPFASTLVLKNAFVTRHEYSQSPAEVVGWDGSVYPMAFSIHDYLPKTGKVHLPPNLHLTFKASSFVVCSFVPRMVDYAEGSIPCPYPHANVACDEILYYVSGNFTSRKGIGPLSVSHHPAGLPHGPQPGNYFASVGARFTDELAVMVDTWHPLQYTKAALGIEDPSYVLSWDV